MPLIDPLYKEPVKQVRHETDTLSVEHGVSYSGDRSLPQLMVDFNRALRDRRQMRPGLGRWVEYILPDLRRVYVEANLGKTILGRMPDRNITARVVIKPGGTDYTNDLHNLMMMRMVEVSGDLLDVVRTAGKVGLYVPDPETRGHGGVTGAVGAVREKMANQSALEFMMEKEAIDPATLATGVGVAAHAVPAAALLYGAHKLRRKWKDRKDPYKKWERDVKKGFNKIRREHMMAQAQANAAAQMAAAQRGMVGSHSYAPGSPYPA